MTFFKNDLVKDHYVWTQTPAFTGAPSRRLFDKVNGDQVLLVINFLGETIGKLTLNDGHKLEELILTQLPEDARSEVAVYNWLRNAYLY